MTLNAAVASGNGFVVMASDRRRVRRDSNGVIVEAYDDEKKVIRLTDKVLLTSGGKVGIAAAAVAMIAQRIEPDFDLAQCKEVLEEVIRKTKEMDTHNALDDTETLGLIFNGFYDDGRLGVVHYGSGPGAEVVEKTCEDTKFFHVNSYPRSVERDVGSALTNVCLYLDEAEEANVTFQDAIERALGLYVFGSYIAPEVSPTCDFRVLYLEDGQIRYKAMEFDVTRFQKHLPTVESVKRILLDDYADMMVEKDLFGEVRSNERIAIAETNPHDVTFRFRTIGSEWTRT